jgi:cytochrome c oxidase cbb3-type subunit 2
MIKHAIFEKNSLILLAATLVVVSIGGLVQIAPLFYLKSTIEKVEGMRPYSPLELAGRDIYIREGCYNCHSQMIRSLRDEVERYGHYSLAAESMYDHPFQWGSKRTGPDLARVGGKYSDAWHVDHLKKPKSVVPASIMPGYPFLATTPLDISKIELRMKSLQAIGVPYSNEQIARAKADIAAQLSPDSKEGKVLLASYPKAQVRKFDGQPILADQKPTPTEMDALVAYLQMLGTLVDFAKFDASGRNLR